MFAETRLEPADVATNNWLLLETLDVKSPTVVKSGPRSRPRVPLAKFLRSKVDATKALGLVAKTVRTAQPGLAQVTKSRLAVAEPLIAETGSVHAVWLHIAPVGAAMCGLRSPVQTVTWNVGESTVQLSAGGAQNASRNTTVSVAEFTGSYNFGNELYDLFRFALAPENPNRVHGFNAATADKCRTADVYFAKHDNGGETMIRGLICPDEQPTQRKAPGDMSNMIARCLMSANDKHALVDLTNLDVLHWCGEPDNEISWKMRHRHATLGRLHIDDLQIARNFADTVKNRADRQGPIFLRFMLKTGEYRPYRISATRISFGPTANAALVTMTPGGDRLQVP